MSARPVAPKDEQPESFEFEPEVWAEAEKIIARYPEGRQQSAVMPLLDLAQRQHGWLPEAAIRTVAEKLGMPYIRAYEVATFYTMYNLAPVGKFHLQLCRTTPCWLRGADDLRRAIRDRTGLDHAGVSADGTFSLVEVECLGACCNAPMMQINDDYFEDLDYDSTCALLDKLAAGEDVTPGPVSGRKYSEPAEGRKTLLERAGGAS
ncbi:NADH-quinone oxidoreductase subunit NuoE [Minwuia thermotolerans]|uniref:NADH-quinone oxidoreductase subunit NuoE n=1 Tax=Minwuia thermotolerans TaxID=2056226 RepID=A0A2M9G1Q9_9PROT|nr:NADH-quinone oxidoreductase subunit NuoE [Minwuia thermotolerans]PJK29650.1 NADH-quinone oxidoreductase subunit NuoE [Minwuia thermotolerans]